MQLIALPLNLQLRCRWNYNCDSARVQLEASIRFYLKLQLIAHAQNQQLNASGAALQCFMLDVGWNPLLHAKHHQQCFPSLSTNDAIYEMTESTYMK